MTKDDEIKELLGEVEYLDKKNLHLQSVLDEKNLLIEALREEITVLKATR